MHLVGRQPMVVFVSIHALPEGLFLERPELRPPASWHLRKAEPTQCNLVLSPRTSSLSHLYFPSYFPTYSTFPLILFPRSNVLTHCIQPFTPDFFRCLRLLPVAVFSVNTRPSHRCAFAVGLGLLPCTVRKRAGQARPRDGNVHIHLDCFAIRSSRFNFDVSSIACEEPRAIFGVPSQFSFVSSFRF
jgi:hypothetical protein